MLESIVVIAVIALVVGSAVAYIIKQKKSGAKCIGCPYAKECVSKKSCHGNSKGALPPTPLKPFL